MRLAVTISSQVGQVGLVGSVGQVGALDPGGPVGGAVTARAAWQRQNRLLLAAEYESGQVVLQGRPVHLKLELTNFCNLACPMCPHGQMQRSVGHMEPALFCSILDQAGPALEFAYVHHLGESLLHPRVGELIAEGKRRGVAMGLSTNASFLDARKSRALLHSGLDFLVISLDAASDQAYAQLRRGGDFARTTDNVRRFLMQLRTSGSALRPVIQMIVSDHNRSEMQRFAEQWEGLAVFKAARDWAGQVSLLPLRLGKSAPSGAGQGAGAGLGPAVEPVGKPPWLPPCRLLWTELTVMWDGRVVPCANHYDPVNVLGDLSRQSLAEVWNGSALQRLRQRHLQDQVAGIPVCQTCPRHPLSREDFVAHDQLTQRLRNYVNTDGELRAGLS